jgi:hypothetical protein
MAAAAGGTERSVEKYGDMGYIDLSGRNLTIPDIPEHR